VCQGVSDSVFLFLCSVFLFRCCAGVCWGVLGCAVSLTGSCAAQAALFMNYQHVEDSESVDQLDRGDGK
jgi:hypothetical protein